MIKMSEFLMISLEANMCSACDQKGRNFDIVMKISHDLKGADQAKCADDM